MVNLIFVTLDGLRRDRLKLCDNLKQIIDRSIFFSNVITAAPYTLASMHAIFSGVYPTRNGVNSYYNMFRFKGDRFKTIADHLKKVGYACEGCVLNKNIIPNQSFDKVHIQEHGENVIDKHKKLLDGIAGNDKFFLYLQYSPIHDKMVENVGKKFSDFDDEYFGNVEKNMEMYDSFVRDADKYVMELMEHIRKLELDDNTLIVFHSDHGVSNGEKKGEKMYGSYLYDYTIKTFFIMSGPGLGPKRIDLQCGSVDILPTLLENVHVGYDVEEPMNGKSLGLMISGEEVEDRQAFAETGGLFGPWPSREKHNVFCLRKNNMKIIHNTTPDTWEFYNLADDPGEKDNLVHSHSDAEIYKSELKDLMRLYEIIE